MQYMVSSRELEDQHCGQHCSPWFRKKYQIIKEKSFFNFPFIGTNFNSIQLNNSVPRLVEIGSLPFLTKKTTYNYCFFIVSSEWGLCFNKHYSHYRRIRYSFMPDVLKIGLVFLWKSLMEFRCYFPWKGTRPPNKTNLKFPSIKYILFFWKNFLKIINLLYYLP